MDTTKRQDLKERSSPHGNTGNRNAAGKRVQDGQGRIGMQISVTQAQRDEIKRRATEAGMTITEWLLDGRL
jgi:hypothetical protein